MCLFGRPPLSIAVEGLWSLKTKKVYTVCICQSVFSMEVEQNAVCKWVRWLFSRLFSGFYPNHTATNCGSSENKDTPTDVDAIPYKLLIDTLVTGLDRPNERYYRLLPFIEISYKILLSQWKINSVKNYHNDIDFESEPIDGPYGHKGYRGCWCLCEQGSDEDVIDGPCACHPVRMNLIRIKDLKERLTSQY